MLNHPIVEESFKIIDREVGNHNFTREEYAIARRVIHATADFDYLDLLQFRHNAIASGITGIQNQVPIVTDVTMVKQGIRSMVAKTFGNEIISAVELAKVAEPGKTRTETGLLNCWDKYPEAIYVIGNAPTALLALCDRITTTNITPTLIIGVPVGFVSVVESKQALARLNTPQILTQGRKGGSPVAAAIVNALCLLAWEDHPWN
ncbi:MAG: cobalt-precorrin-8X methylmutase [Xenococcaceae cyanobacterium MO_234.B1]|nr:cobalt-precorrin-8X methylmutase [Xenococcaceae cyanobacterium MO_234.B1]